MRKWSHYLRHPFLLYTLFYLIAFLFFPDKIDIKHYQASWIFSLTYCCRNSNSHTNINLPTKHPFYLLQFGSDCQQVRLALVIRRVPGVSISPFSYVIYVSLLICRHEKVHTGPEDILLEFFFHLFIMFYLNSYSRKSPWICFIHRNEVKIKNAIIVNLYPYFLFKVKGMSFRRLWLEFKANNSRPLEYISSSHMAIVTTAYKKTVRFNVCKYYGMFVIWHIVT